MVDLFVLVMMHSLLALAAWQLMLRQDLDTDPVANDEERAEPSQSA